jgi:6-phosphogluconolactonase (cycloisomerase 2 family)
LKFLYVSDLLSYKVSAFAVDGTTGALVEITGSPFATVSAPWGMAVDPSGKFLYASSSGGASNVGIAAYTIDSTTGALAPIAGSPYASGYGNYSIAITPNGQFVYVTNHADNTISGYALNGSTGVLTPLVGNPFTAAVGVYALAIHPSGSFLYAANTVDNVGTGSVTAYAIDSVTGALTSTTGSPYATGSGAVSVALDPAGKFLYVANYSGGTVSAYSVNQSTGALAAVAGSPFDTGAGPGNKSTYSVTVDPSGAYLYASNGVQGNVSAFAIDSVSGALTLVAGGPFTAGPSPVSVITIP